MTTKISKERLLEMIKEEITTISEQVDHEGVRKVVTGASKLLKAVDAFKSDANGHMMGAAGVHIDALMKMLENMIETPSSYVDKPKPVVKTVKLRAVKD